MIRQPSIGRRSVLRAAGGITLTSVFAGCLSGGGLLGPKNVESWLSETENYNDTIDNRTGTKSVTVEVGPKGNEWAFVPAAIKVVPGTTVTWEWIEKEGGGGNPHNVVATNNYFNSGEPISSETYYKHTFESAGTHYYYCEPHKHLGMKGAIVVADSA